MFAGAALVLCLTNATDVVANGQLRDGRTKTTSAQLPGASLTYREPVAQHALPTVAPGRTECASFDPAPLTRPQLVVWSAAPVDADKARDDAACALPEPLAAGQKLTFIYRKTLLGQVQCKESR